MKDNKLIAKFMGAEFENEYQYAKHNWMSEDYLKYHRSWDWLMPVVEKCLTTGDRQHFVINDALLTCNIEEVYKAVVEFIKTYNDGQ